VNKSTATTTTRSSPVATMVVTNSDVVDDEGR